MEGATPRFWPLVRHGTRLTGARSGARLTPPRGVAPSTVIPGGKAIELMRKPESMTLPGNAATTGMFAIGAASSGWTSGRRHRFTEQVLGRDLCRTEYYALYQVIDARRSLEVWQTHYSRVRPHSAGREQSDAVSPGGRDGAEEKPAAVRLGKIRLQVTLKQTVEMKKLCRLLRRHAAIDSIAAWRSKRLPEGGF